MADKDKQNIVKTRLLVLTKMFYEKVVKNIKKVANNVANGGKQQIHQIERNLSINKAKKQKTLQKQKAVKLLQKGIKDLLLYKDRQGIVGEVANEMIVDVQAIIEKLMAAIRMICFLILAEPFSTRQLNRIESNPQVKCYRRENWKTVNSRLFTI